MSLASTRSAIIEINTSLLHLQVKASLPNERYIKYRAPRASKTEPGGGDDDWGSVLSDNEVKFLMLR